MPDKTDRSAVNGLRENSAAASIGGNAARTDTSAFERSKAAIEATGHTILDESARRNYIETTRAIYFIARRDGDDAMSLMSQAIRALTCGKDFAVHAIELSEASLGSLRGSGLVALGEKYHTKVVIADTEQSVASSIANLEMVGASEWSVGTSEFDSDTAIGDGDVGAGSAFALTTAELRKLRIRIVGSSPTRGFIETARTIYYAADARRFDATLQLECLLKAIADGKGFASHSIGLSESQISTLRTSVRSAGKALKVRIATDGRSISDSVERSESMSAMQRAWRITSWCIADRFPSKATARVSPFVEFLRYVSIGDVAYLLVTFALCGIAFSEVNANRPLDPQLIGYWFISIALTRAVLDLLDHTLRRLKRLIETLDAASSPAAPPNGGRLGS